MSATRPAGHLRDSTSSLGADGLGSFLHHQCGDWLPGLQDAAQLPRVAECLGPGRRVHARQCFHL